LRYPRLTSGGLLALVGMGLASSCGGANPGYGPDAGDSGTNHSKTPVTDAGADSGDAD